MALRARRNLVARALMLGFTACASGTADDAFAPHPCEDASALGDDGSTDASPNAVAESSSALPVTFDADGDHADGTTADGTTHDGESSETGSDDAPAPSNPASDGALPPGPPGLAYWFPFDGDGTDESGFGHDGTLFGVTFVADRNGNPASAAQFDGSTSWMSASGVLLPLGAGARTVAAWVSPASSPPPGLYGGSFVSRGSGDCIGQMFGLGDIGDELKAWTGCNDVLTNSALPRSTWTFVAIRFTPPTTVDIWTGSSMASETLLLPIDTSPSLFWVGAETTGNTSASIRQHFMGAIDSLRVYDRALSDSEVTFVSSLP